MPLHIVRDSEQRTFALDGDSLTLRSAIRQRDIEESDALAVQDAFKALSDLKAAGIDPTAELAKASASEVTSATTEASKPSAAVRELRLKLLAVSLVVSGETFGGQAIIDTYREMDPDSVAWVDAQVESVWASAMPGEADTRG